MRGFVCCRFRFVDTDAESHLNARPKRRTPGAICQPDTVRWLHCSSVVSDVGGRGLRLPSAGPFHSPRVLSASRPTTLFLVGRTVDRIAWFVYDGSSSDRYSLLPIGPP